MGLKEEWWWQRSKFKFDDSSTEIIQFDKKRKNIKRKINREDIKKSNIGIMIE